MTGETKTAGYMERHFPVSSGQCYTMSRTNEICLPYPLDMPPLTPILSYFHLRELTLVIAPVIVLEFATVSIFMVLLTSRFS
jgi:hypothetical protein